MKIQQNSDQLSPEMTIDTSTNRSRLMEKETFPTQLYRHIKVDITISLKQSLQVIKAEIFAGLKVFGDSAIKINCQTKV